MDTSFVQMSLHYHTIYYNFLKFQQRYCYITSTARNSNNRKGRISCVKLKFATSAKFTELGQASLVCPHCGTWHTCTVLEEADLVDTTTIPAESLLET